MTESQYPHASDSLEDQPSAPEAEELQNDDLVYALTCTPDMAQWFAARGSGLYRSQDGGATWTCLFDSLNLESALLATSVVLSPDYDGASHASLFAGVPGGVVRSVDGGETWFASILDSPPPAVSSMAISPNFVEDGVVLAATTDDGIYRSATHGTHWARWNFGLLDLTVFCLAISPGFAQDETLYAGVESGIFRSTNGGRAWREIDLPIGYESVLSLTLSPHYPEDGTLFAGTEGQGLFISEDNGLTWSRRGADLIVDPVNGILVSPGSPNQLDVLVLSDDALWLSRDGGQAWVQIQGTPPGMTAVAAPQGLSAQAPLLIGTVDGHVEAFELDE